MSPKSLFFCFLFFFIVSVSTVDIMRLHGGPVMDKPISLHYIYYGPWGPKDEETLLTIYFGKNIGFTSWFNVARCMEDNDGDPITDHVDVASTSILKDIHRWGDDFTDKAQISALAQTLIQESDISLDANDIYVLWLHDDVNAEFLCDDTCGYHSYFNNSGNTPIKFIVVGAGGSIGMQCDGCKSPNGPWNPLTNQLVNSFAHQLVDTVSNPVPWTGWYDANTKESAQKCVTSFPDTGDFNPNRQKNYNIVLGANGEPHWFLIQGNWDIISNDCRMEPYADCRIVSPPKASNSNPHAPSSGVMAKANLYIASALVLLVSLVFLF